MPFLELQKPLTMVQKQQQLLLLAACSGIAAAVAIPAPTVLPVHVVAPAPVITPAVIQFDSTRSYQRRNIISDIESDVGSVLTALGSDIPSYVISGMSFTVSRPQQTFGIDIGLQAYPISSKGFQPALKSKVPLVYPTATLLQHQHKS